MGEARRHPQLLVVLGAQHRPHPLAERGGTAAEIHRHIENLPQHAPHQLALGMGRQLVVQAAQHASAGEGVVVLHKRGGADQPVEHPLVPALEEKAALVAEQARSEEQRAFQGEAGGRGERVNHASMVSSSRIR